MKRPVAPLACLAGCLSHCHARVDSTNEGAYRQAERGGTLVAPSQSSPTDLTRLLIAWGNGDISAADELIPLVYERELHAT